MAPAQLKFVVSFSSQDDTHKVHNLISSDGNKKWLTHPKDRTGQAEAVFQLDKPCVISYIDIGSVWSAMIEVQVGCSDWPQDRMFQTLVPTCSLMTPGDCRLTQNFNRTRMFGPKDFAEDVAQKEWDRIKVICRQPFKREVQFGLTFLHLKSSDKTTSCDDKSAGTKSVKSIQNHFFRKSPGSKTKEDELRTKLLKIAGSSENGTEHKDSLTRSAKLVLAGNTTGQRMIGKRQDIPDAKPSLYSSHMAQKYGPQFEDEVQEFLKKLHISEEELDKVTIADLRHKFERSKKRKLTPEEKKTFVKLAREHICAFFGEDTENVDTCKTKDMTSQKQRLNKSDTPCKKQMTGVSKERGMDQSEKKSMKQKSQGKNEQKKENPCEVKQSPCVSKKSQPFVHIKHGRNLQEKDSNSSPKPFMDKLVKNFGFSPRSPSKIKESYVKRCSENVPKAEISVTKPVSQKSVIDYQDSDSSTDIEENSTDDRWLNSKASPVAAARGTGRGSRCTRGGGKKRGSQGRGRSRKSGYDEDMSEDETPAKKRRTSVRGRRGRGRGRASTPSTDTCVTITEPSPPKTDQTDQGWTSRKFCPDCSEWIPQTVYSDHVALCKNSPKTDPWENSGGFLQTNTLYSNSGFNQSSQFSAYSNSSHASSNRGRVSQVSDVVDVETYHEYELETTDSYVECPICSDMFSTHTIEVHAAICCEMSMVY